MHIVGLCLRCLCLLRSCVLGSARGWVLAFLGRRERELLVDFAKYNRTRTCGRDKARSKTVPWQVHRSLAVCLINMSVSLTCLINVSVSLTLSVVSTKQDKGTHARTHTHATRWPHALSCCPTLAHTVPVPVPMPVPCHAVYTGRRAYDYSAGVWLRNNRYYRNLDMGFPLAGAVQRAARTAVCGVPGHMAIPKDGEEQNFLRKVIRTNSPALGMSLCFRQHGRRCPVRGRAGATVTRTTDLRIRMPQECVRCCRYLGTADGVPATNAPLIILILLLLIIIIVCPARNVRTALHCTALHCTAPVLRHGVVGIMDGKRSFARVPQNDSHHGEANVYGDNDRYAWLPLSNTGPLASGSTARYPWDPVAAIYWITGCVV